MTNKDYSYLEDILKNVIAYVYDKTYHTRAVGKVRLNAINEKLSKLSPDEREYIKIKTLEFFEIQKRDHERNLARKK